MAENTDGVQAVHPMRDGYTGSVLDSAPNGHKLTAYYATREQADAAQAWLADGVLKARACEYNGGACQRGGCADGCQAVQVLHQRREQADAHGVPGTFNDQQEQ